MFVETRKATNTLKMAQQCLMTTIVLASEHFLRCGTLPELNQLSSSSVHEKRINIKASHAFGLIIVVVSHRLLAKYYLKSETSLLSNFRALLSRC
jgi:hypothetical protein